LRPLRIESSATARELLTLKFSGLGRGRLGEARAESASPRRARRIIELRAFQWGFEPKEIVVYQYDRVVIKIVESLFKEDPTYKQHSFTFLKYGINLVLSPIPPNELVTVEFVADKVGEFAFECAIFCEV